MRIILLGPPGSGKGTQGERIAAAYGIPRFSTGELLREAVAKGTDFGRRAKAAMDKGELVNDDIVIGLIEERIKAEYSEKGYILDGFPRNTAQAQALERMEPERDELALEIQVDDREVIDRLTARRTCPKCGAVYNLKQNPPADPDICDNCGGRLMQRDDDRPEVIENRLDVYRQQTEILMEYYKEKGVYQAIDGNGSIDTVFLRIKKNLEKRINGIERSL